MCSIFFANIAEFENFIYRADKLKIKKDAARCCHDESLTNAQAIVATFV